MNHSDDCLEEQPFDGSVGYWKLEAGEWTREQLLLPPIENAIWFMDEASIRDKYWRIEPGQVVIDVGSHWGSYTVPALAAGAFVWAIEPSAEAAGVLQKVVDGTEVDGSRLTIVREALAGKEGYPTEFIDWLSPQGGAMFALPATSPFTTLDALVKRYELSRIDWIKIDVEGAETFVLDGARESIKRLRPSLIIEDHTRVYPIVGDMGSAAWMDEFFADLGYKVDKVPYLGFGSNNRDFWICRP